MKPFSRTTLLALCAASLLPALAAHAQDDFPSRPITIVVPVPPGGIVDMAARLAGDPLTLGLEQPVVVDNRTGASGNIAYNYVADARPDGYTLLASYSMYHAGNPSLFTNLRWNKASFVPVGMVAVAPHVVVVHPSLPVHSLTELVDYAKAHPGEVNYASQGSGSVPHVGTELLRQMTGIDVVHVPYKGSGPAIQDVLSGQVQMFITTPPSVIGHVQQGKLRAIAVAGSKRHPMLPDVPTAGEQGFKNFELEAWVSLFAPAGTPPATIERLTQALKAGLAQPVSAERAAAAGIEVRYQPPGELQATVDADTAHWSQVIKSAGIVAN
ncbi:Bug family tripartite tricarboxylate transporter substrate binding protein [Bordetella petrii]|uniref:Bug family tripartite tricarboxylate transporter substrate binding protein n=1 Tax=Bordetella petrii TaxID=94624 RepID=UPI001E38FACD|nr:tripartite tricarboxylate transporter substrate binding protein [Bordetella petrii]MCD0503662.1 tripartite tricarboxylate transporter substrate binding protein [Bordetella petrii]